MRRLMLLVLSAFCLGCKSAGAIDGLGLRFSSYGSTPVVLTHFAIEGPLGEIHPQIAAGESDTSMPRSGGVYSISAPMDVGDDGLWHLSAQWVELPTDRAWQAEIDIPVDKLTVSYGDSYELNAIFGPNGLLLIGSDKAGIEPSDKVDVVRTCGHHVPEADTKWRLKTGYFPELPIIMKNMPPVKNPECPFPKS